MYNTRWDVEKVLNLYVQIKYFQPSFNNNLFEESEQYVGEDGVNMADVDEEKEGDNQDLIIEEDKFVAPDIFDFDDILSF